MKPELKKALAAAFAKANLVDRSHRGLHEALVSLVILAVVEGFLEVLTAYVQKRRKDSPNTVTTASVEEWLKQDCQLTVGQEGDVSFKLDPKEYGGKWAQHIKDNPWYVRAKKMQEFKVPVIDVKSLARMIAKRELLGEVTNWDEVLKDLQSEVNLARKQKGTKDWFAEAKKKAEGKGKELKDLLEDEAA